jgi:phi LC3 family holin|nr:MAG TPA: holin [Caudoviricetes sp.]
MRDKVYKALHNVDGTLNRMTLAGLVSALLLLVQQVAGLLGMDLTGQMASVQDCINTALTILTIVGVVSVPKEEDNDDKK